MSYTVQVKNSVLKELRKLPKTIADQVAGEIDILSDNPRPPGHKKLKGTNNLYRLRTGDYRIIYQINDKILIVLVIRIGNRKDVYRDL